MEYQTSNYDPNRDQIFCMPTQQQPQQLEQKQFFNEQESRFHERNNEQAHLKGNILSCSVMLHVIY